MVYYTDILLSENKRDKDRDERERVVNNYKKVLKSRLRAEELRKLEKIRYIILP